MTFVNPAEPEMPTRDEIERLLNQFKKDSTKLDNVRKFLTSRGLRQDDVEKVMSDLPAYQNFGEPVDKDWNSNRQV